MNEELFLQNISEDGKEWYRIIIETLRKNFTNPFNHYFVTYENGSMECRVSIGYQENVAGLFSWQARNRNFKVYLRIRHNTPLISRLGLNGIDRANHGACLSKCVVAGAEDAEKVGVALAICAKALEDTKR